jgi:hypothetical protein
LTSALPFGVRQAGIDKKVTQYAGPPLPDSRKAPLGLPQKVGAALETNEPINQRIKEGKCQFLASLNTCICENAAT